MLFFFFTNCFVFRLQKPAPYCGIVYTDLSHSTDVNTGRINSANLPTIYADIDYLKTDASKSNSPEKTEAQTKEGDNDLQKTGQNFLLRSFQILFT